MVRLALPSIAVGLALVAGCAADEGDELAEGGVLLDVRYDSSMGVRRLAVVGVDPEGAVVWARTEVDPPLTLGPPGPRAAPLTLPAPAGPTLALVDGLDADGRVVGSAQADLQPPLEGPVVIRLGTPVVCGDGVRAGREACDDGNTEPGDGCSALCLVEADPPPPPPPEGPRLLEAEALDAFSVEGADAAPVPGATLEIPEPEAGTRWLVFASGVLGATAEAEVSAELDLTLDGEILDAFGHQTLADSRAGFLSFFAAPRGGRVQAMLRAVAGVGTVAQLRLVAVRVPESAWGGAAALEEAVEVEGIDVELLSLGFEVNEPGAYLLLGRGTVSESPGGDTARLWMQTGDGRVPEGPAGVTFSASRDARVPFFAAHLTELAPGDHRVRLAGTTSGSGSLSGPVDGRFAFRRRISVQAQGAAVPEGYALPVTFDHAAMVAAGRARPDGADVRVLFDRGGELAELPRAPDPDRGWGREDTTIWFRFPVSLLADGTSGDAWLYFGREDVADRPPEDLAALFPIFDGFDEEVLDARWTTDNRALRPSGGQLRLMGGASMWTSAAMDNLPGPILVEARLRFVDGDASPTRYLTVGAARDSTFAGAGFGTEDGIHGYGTANQVQPYAPQTPEIFHRYAIGLDTQEAAFWQDDTAVGRTEAGLTTVVRQDVFMSNGSDVDVVYDWVRVRPWVDPAPAVGLEPLEGSAGVQPSRYAGLRLVALRLDALGDVVGAVAREPVTTTETATVTLATVEAPPAEDAARFTLMATRVAGAAGEGRKVGLCLADEQALLQTAHVINRDDGDQAGYHHVAGVVDAFPPGERFSTAVRSPDGVRVEGASSTVLVVDL